jgi:hypothetical protein
MLIRRYKPEQIETLLRQVEAEIATGRATEGMGARRTSPSRQG